MKIDQQSKDFIEKTLNRLRDERQFLELVNEVMGDTFRFYMDTPREILISLLKEKMEKGALEHGPIKTNPTQITGEIRNEDLDKLGWTSMRLEAEGIDKSKDFIV